MSNWYIYLIRCKDGSLYTGITTDVDRRFAEHQQKGDTGAKYLRGRGPLQLIFKKELGNRSLALKVEARIKKLPKAKKEYLLKNRAELEKIIQKISD